MAVEEITHVSWVERIKQSAVGMGTGAALVAAMIGTLFWNEGRAVQTARSLAEGAGLVVERPADQIDPAFHNQLIHVSGATSAAEGMTDPDFGLAFDGLRLERKVEMYQWVQNSKTEKAGNTGGSETQITTYTYEPSWRESWQDSSQFKEPAGHANPQMRFSSFKVSADGAKLGAYALDGEAVSQLGGAQAQSLTEAQLGVVRDVLGYGERAELVKGGLYVGRNPENPMIGDYRITYSVVPFSTVSVAGRQHETGIGRYRTENGDAILLVEQGSRGAKDMFATAQSSNSSTTWLIRLGALLALIVGFSMIFKPLSVLASVLPFLGSVVAFGTGIIATICGLGLGSLVIAVAWFVYRPILSVVVLGLALLVIGSLIYLGRRRKAVAPKTAAADA